jgi:hypothetical protein
VPFPRHVRHVLFQNLTLINALFASSPVRIDSAAKKNIVLFFSTECTPSSLNDAVLMDEVIKHSQCFDLPLRVARFKFRPESFPSLPHPLKANTEVMF